MLTTAPSPELIDALFNCSPVAMWVFDRETLRFLAVNDEAVRRYGYSREEFLARTILDIRPVDQRDGARAAVDLPDGSARPRHWLHRTASGEVIDVEVRRAADLELAGRPARLVIIRDVTEERRALASLRASERRFRAVLEHGTDALVFQCAEGKIIWAAASARNILGCPIDQLVGRQGLDLVHPDDRAAIVAARADSLARPFERIRGVARYGPREGPWRWLEVVRENRLDDPAVGAVVVHLRDVTEQKLAEEALRRSEESFRNVIESSPDLVVVAREGLAVYVNAAVLGALGLAREGVLGRPVLEAVHPEDRALVRAGLSVAPGASRPEVTEGRLVCADGSSLSVEFRAVPVDFAGAPAVLAFGRDVTERRRLEGRLAVADRMSSIGSLAAGVAHEINNPVASSLANVGFLAEAMAPHLAAVSAPERRELEETLRDVRDGLERVRVIVRDLKTFSHLDEQALGPVELRGVLDSACRLAFNELKHRARLVRSGLEEPVWVQGSEGRLAQVFVNLLVNAAQSIPEGAAGQNEVRLAVRRGDDGRVRVEVQDTGGGIRPEHLPRLFDPFFTTKAKGVGTGLGLSICHSIVRAHGGAIEVESAPGRGSCFRVALLGCVPAGPAADPEPAPAPFPRVSVLVVDDEPGVCASISRLLKAEHEVVTYSSSRTARELLLSGARFDAVLCDVMMPELTGVQLHAAVRERAPEQAARFVFMTGGVFSAETRALLANTGRPVLHKPFEKAQLLAALRELQESTR
ncbi:PAS domain-containing hybrid sensor histidine kinase/response regulator [Anaeromyxobacter paludicola]|uniref:histidine kinase n=1 Tax=Anaeromyxobacter paludicola TaxID=2918171 RepID=A0ABM7X517_9BACT|nr:PAS domain S-box protein [Anaeromyxobacter paludicola]BDG06900.1 hypothetical protein AMPC_00130 [Anaeromyxobacter paludicola]